jgi:hypothetical protein
MMDPALIVVPEDRNASVFLTVKIISLCGDERDNSVKERDER